VARLAIISDCISSTTQPTRKAAATPTNLLGPEGLAAARWCTRPRRPLRTPQRGPLTGTCGLVLMLMIMIMMMMMVMVSKKGGRSRFVTHPPPDSQSLTPLCKLPLRATTPTGSWSMAHLSNFYRHPETRSPIAPLCPSPPSTPQPPLLNTFLHPPQPQTGHPPRQVLLDPLQPRAPPRQLTVAHAAVAADGAVAAAGRLVGGRALGPAGRVGKGRVIGVAAAALWERGGEPGEEVVDPRGGGGCDEGGLGFECGLGHLFFGSIFGGLEFLWRGC